MPSKTDFIAVFDSGVGGVSVLRDAMKLIRAKLIEVMRRLSKFALEYKDLPCLGYTHLQPAQLTTVGKRACLWLQDLYMDLDELDDATDALKGVAVVMISSEMPEVLGMSDRVAVMHQGEITGVFDNDESLTQEKILYYATGGDKHTA